MLSGDDSLYVRQFQALRLDMFSDSMISRNSEALTVRAAQI